MVRASLWVFLLAPFGLAGDPAPLVERLRDGRVDERVAAARALGRKRVLAAADALESALADPDARVRREAAVALAIVSPESGAGVPILVETLGSADWYERWRACVALKRIGPKAKRAVPVLLETLCDADVDTCREASLALGAIAPGDARVVRGLRRVYRTHPTDRSVVAHVLRRIDPYFEAWEPSDPFRRGAVREWDALLGELARGDAPTRIDAAHALAARRAPHADALAAARAALLARVGDTSPEVRSAARHGLYRLRGLPRLPRARYDADDVRAAFRAAGLVELAGRLRTPDPFWGVLPEHGGCYRALGNDLLDGELGPRALEVLGLLVWEDPEYARDLLIHGGTDLRTVVVLLVPYVRLDRATATATIERARRDARRSVRAAAGWAWRRVPWR